MSPRLLTFDIPGNEQLFVSPHRLVCYEWGSPSTLQTIICVHGLTRNGRDFDFLAQHLAANGFRVLCPDIVGRGNSDSLTNPAGYSYPTYVADMFYLIHALQLTQVHWIGTSMGGIIGMMVANTAPLLLQSLTLNDIGCLVSAEGLKRILGYAGISMRYATRTEGEQTLRQICAPFGIRDERHWQHLFTYSLKDEPDGSVRFAYDPNIAAALKPTGDVLDIPLWGLWPALQKTPTMLVRGAESDILRHDTALAMKESHPDLTFYEVANCGHAPALMADDQIKTISSWLQNQTR